MFGRDVDIPREPGVAATAAGAERLRLPILIPEGNAAEEIGAFEVEALGVFVAVPFMLDRHL